MNRHELLLLCVSILLIPVSGCNPAADPAASGPDSNVPVEVVVPAERAERTSWPVTVPVSGSLHSRAIVEVRSEVAGRLQAVHFEEGDPVRRNQLLAEIDPANYALALEQARAALAVAEAGLERARVLLEHAEREKERAENLWRSGGITEKDRQAALTGVQEARTQVRLAEAQVGQARAAQAIAEKSLKDCRIHSPMDGRVQRKFFDRGSLLAAGSPVVTLVDNSRLELECPLPARHLSEIRVNLRAAFTVQGYEGRLFEGVVSSINPMVELDNRTVKIRVRIPNPGGELRSGMFARGEIEIRVVPDAFVIPRSAFVAEQEGSSAGSAYIVEEGVARRRPVEVGGSRGDRLWITRGLHEGDLVITRIGPSLQDGMPVRLQTSATGN